jgi:Domain of unknown function (DUF4465)/Dockerin type I domain/PEP-CTERM motif
VKVKCGGRSIFVDQECRKKQAMKQSIYWVVAAAAILLLNQNAPAGIVDFEDVPLAPESYYDGADLAGEFTSQGATFNNAFTDFGGGFTTWEGWACSNTTDATTPGFGNQYSAIAGSGWDHSANYGVAFTNTFVVPAPIVTLPTGTIPLSLRVTNTTYAALSMRDGDSFAKKFGGASGDDPDWFLLTITGLNAADVPIGDVESYLADYRSSDNAQDYILGEWKNVDLTSLAGAAKLSFVLTSSDVGTFGINTPTYFAMDDLSVTRILGDVNSDNVVNIFDVNLVSSHWESQGPAADANGDGIVNVFDINMISVHWGDNLDPGAAAVPEPGTFALLCCGTAVLAAARRWRQRNRSRDHRGRVHFSAIERHVADQSMDRGL